MTRLKKIYRSQIYSDPLAQRFRKIFLNEELAELKPLLKDAVISDLFVWRKDNQWNTNFKLFNISSFLFPEDNVSEECEIHIFGADGKFLQKYNYTLEPFALKNLDFAELINSVDIKSGTFCVFHFSTVIKKFSQKGSHLTERGYIAYSYIDQSIRNFCHGNLQSVSKSRNGRVQSVVGLAKHPLAYHPQMIFSDCDSFELAYTNPSKYIQNVTINFYDKDIKEYKCLEVAIQPFGVEIIRVSNKDRQIHTLSSWGKIVMWRPIIFKYFESYFDVLHG